MQGLGHVYWSKSFLADYEYSLDSSESVVWRWGWKAKRGDGSRVVGWEEKARRRETAKKESEGEEEEGRKDLSVTVLWKLQDTFCGQ